MRQTRLSCVRRASTPVKPRWTFSTTIRLRTGATVRLKLMTCRTSVAMTATSRGKSASGKYGVSVAHGNGVMVKGGMNALLVIAVEHEDDNEIAEWKAAIVDGETIKEDTWYTLKDGEFVEVADEDAN